MKEPNPKLGCRIKAYFHLSLYVSVIVLLSACLSLSLSRSLALSLSRSLALSLSRSLALSLSRSLALSGSFSLYLSRERSCERLWFLCPHVHIRSHYCWLAIDAKLTPYTPPPEYTFLQSVRGRESRERAACLTFSRFLAYLAKMCWKLGEC